MPQPGPAGSSRLVPLAPEPTVQPVEEIVENILCDTGSTSNRQSIPIVSGDEEGDYESYAERYHHIPRPVGEALPEPFPIVLPAQDLVLAYQPMCHGKTGAGSGSRIGDPV